MDGDTRHKLIAHALGDLNDKEAKALQARLEADESLRGEFALIERHVRILRSVPHDDAGQEAVRRLLERARAAEEAPVIPLFRVSPALLSRVAAVLVIAFLFAVGIYVVPDGPPPTVALNDDGNLAEWVTGAELVETRMGAPSTLKFETGEIRLDGGAAVQVFREGRFAPPRVVVDRGRVIVSASSAPLTVEVAGRGVDVRRGGVVAVDYDRAYARIAPDGSLVEVQRMPIEEVAAIAEETYGIRLDAARLPDRVRSSRVTFYGSNLTRDEFVNSFVDAADRFGVKLANGRLQYESRSARIELNEPWTLGIAVLDGMATLREGESISPLDAGGDGPNYIEATAGVDRLEVRKLGRAELSNAVVWASGLGEGLKDIEFSKEPLPRRTVIHTDKMVVRGPMGERHYLLDGPEFNFPLPGGREGRVVQLMSSGVAFEVKGEVKRVFVPFSKLSEGE